MKKLMLMSMLCFLFFAGSVFAIVVNVDIGDNQGTFSGQGVLEDSGNDYWNGIGTSGTDLLASDGVTQTGISIALVGQGQGISDYGYGNPNTMLGDYRYTMLDGWSADVADITISGLEANTDYLLYIYSAGDSTNQGGEFTLNGVTGYVTGDQVGSDVYVEGENYVIMEVVSNASGQITGTWTFNSVEGNNYGAFNGIQITPGTLPTTVVGITGAESPQVHSPGDTISVTVGFSDTVTLSQAGDAKLKLDFDGTEVDAVHTGSVTGTSLTFQATAPSVTTMATKAVANSLQLLNGATLLDSESNPVNLGHDEIALPNDQVSVEGLSVYPAVPGLDPSPRYSFRVHEVGSEEWMTPFAWLTYCREDSPYDDYKDWAIGGWSQTYCNFEMANNVPVEVEIIKLDPSTGLPVDIKTAVAHPRRRVKSWRVENGKAYVIFEQPVLFAVDIDGALDETIAPRAQASGGYPYIGENAIHTVTVFANPFILDKPDLSDPDVYAVEPGQIPPEDGTWTTLYFKPGVHQIFEGTYDWLEDFRVHANRSYYIPGDAIVHGNMNNNRDSSDAQNIRIFGHGTLSGERIPHPAAAFGVPGTDGWPCSPIWIGGAQGCKVEGITLADGAFHSCALAGSNTTNPALANYVRWAKTITWRDNGDGIQSRPGCYIEDCFMRCQDDGSYVDGMGIRRNVYWTDVNGGILRCTYVTSYNHALLPGGHLYVEDIDVIYARSANNDNNWHGVITLPSGNDSAGDYTGSLVVFRNINVEDLLPGRKLFAWDSAGKLGDVAGIRFENVRAAAPHVFGAQDNILGDPLAHIYNLIFDDVILAGTHYDSINDFEHNEYAYSFVFENTAPETMTYLNNSGYGKWYIKDDWNSGVEPASNDIVNHTAVSGELTVDGPAYAGTLNVSNAATATISVEYSGSLTVTGTLSLGDGSGHGDLNIEDGTVHVQSLSVVDGDIHIDKGTLLWAGDHISDIQSLYSGGHITFTGGQGGKLSYSATLIDQIGTSELYADYDNATSGYTTVWVTDTTIVVPITVMVEAEDYTAMSGIQTESCSDVGGGQNIGWIDNGDWAEYSIEVPAAGTYAVDFRVASNTTVDVYAGTIDMVVDSSTIGTVDVLGTGGWQTWTTISTTAVFDAGTQTLRLSFPDGGFNLNWFKLTLIDTIPPATPTGLVAVAGDNSVSLDWDDNSESDLASYGVYRSEIAGGPYTHLQDVAASDYVDNTASNGTTYYYVVTAIDTSSNESGISSEVSATPQDNQPPSFTADPINEADATEGVAYSSTIADDASDPESDPMTFSKVSGPAWLSVAANGDLSGTPTNDDVGANAFTVQVDATGGSDTATLNITVVAASSSIKVEAEDYTDMNGIAVEACSDTGGGQNIGWIHNGDWAEYSIEVPVAGTYAVDFRVASGTSGGTINMVVDSNTIGTVDVPGTGGWQTWITISTTATFDTAGPQTLRLDFVGGGGGLFNINWFELAVQASNQAPSFTADPINEADATEDAAYSSTIADDASDPESDPMTFSKVSGPAWLIVAADGTLSGTPGAGDVGANVFTVQVDATGGSDQATLNITVIAATDTDPPTPNPATWAVAPAADSDTAISMTATTGSDATGPVEYYFDEISGNPGGTDSGWQTSPSYTDTGLSPSTQYTYTVTMRDSVTPTPNMGTPSSPANATTDPAPDTDPPTPNPATFAVAPAADSDTAISMTAMTGSDATGPVEYYFDEISGNPGGTDSGWQTSPSYTDTGLDPSTQYTYTVTMRDSVTPTPNVGTASSPASATTDPAPTIPAAPSNLSATAVSKTQIDLSWTDNSGNETGFKIERSKRVNSNFVQIDTVGPDVTSYSDTTAKKNTLYYYRVRATNANGDSPYSNEASAKTPK